MRGLASVLACVVPVLVHLVRRLERKATVARRASLGRFVGSVIGASLLLLGLGSAQPAAADCASGYVGGRAGSCGYDAATTLRVAGTVAADGSCVALGDSRILAVPPQEHANGTSTTPSTRKVATEAGAGVADDVAGRLPWNSYAEYPKVSVGGREYAQIGDRLYTQHAVDRMMPSGLGSSGAPGGAFGAGRSISPNFVEDVIRTGSSTTEIVDGVTRTIFRSGTVTVVTEDGGRLVVTVMTH